MSRKCPVKIFLKWILFSFIYILIDKHKTDENKKENFTWRGRCYNGLQLIITKKYRNDSVGGYTLGITDGPPVYKPKSNGSPKVFRRTFKLQDNPCWDMKLKGEQIPASFMSKHQFDITDNYCPTDSLTVKLERLENNSTLYWLCQICENGSILPVNYSFANNNGELNFPHTTSSLVYIIGKYTNKELKSVGNPFFSLGKTAFNLTSQIDSLVDYQFQKRFWASSEFDKNEKERSFNVKYWYDGWHNVKASGKLTEISSQKMKDVLHYEIKLTNVPKGALFISKGVGRFTFNKTNDYYKLD